MTPFQSLVVLKRPRHELWTIMRDRLADLARCIEEVEQIEQMERTDVANGVVHVVNKWRVRQQVTASIQSFLPIDELSWVDRNRWDISDWVCSWTIEPTFLREHITCSGQTSFASAMGGQGTRVTFAGELDMKPGWISALGNVEPIVAGLAESVVTTIIPRNLRAVAEAAAAYVVPV